jgi:hypothetical protein
VVLAEYISVTGRRIQMVLAQLAGDTPVGDDIIEIVHEVSLGHHRQTPDFGLRQRSDVDARQPSAMPRRSLDRRRQQRAQRPPPLTSDAILRPVDAAHIFGEQRFQISDMTATPFVDVGFTPLVLAHRVPGLVAQPMPPSHQGSPDDSERSRTACKACHDSRQTASRQAFRCAGHSNLKASAGTLTTVLP